MTPDFLFGAFIGGIAALAINELAWSLADWAARQTAKAHVRPSAQPRRRW